MRHTLRSAVGVMLAIGMSAVTSARADYSFANADFGSGDFAGWSVSANGDRTGAPSVSVFDVVTGGQQYAATTAASLDWGNYGAVGLNLTQLFTFSQSGTVKISADGAATATTVNVLSVQAAFSPRLDGGTYTPIGAITPVHNFEPGSSTFRGEVSGSYYVEPGNYQIGFGFYVSVGAPSTPNTTTNVAGYLTNARISFSPVLSPVAEPTEYAMLVAGLSLLGVTLRRRRSRLLN